MQKNQTKRGEFEVNEEKKLKVELKLAKAIHPNLCLSNEPS